MIKKPRSFGRFVKLRNLANLSSSTLKVALGSYPKLYIPSTINIDLILWHTQLIVCAAK